MQLLRQVVYFWVAAAVPSPWSHWATQLVVWFICCALGFGTPTQTAWQLTSPGVHFARHVVSGVAVWDGAVSVCIVVVDWAMAVRARARMLMVNFILTMEGVDFEVLE
jgi:hypothetical protein